MKKSALIALASAAALLAGCATSQPVGALYTNVSVPVAVTHAQSNTRLKVGVATCTSVFSLVAVGDASIAAAMKNGDITKVHSVDWKAENTLGVIGKYECVVRGE